MFPLMRLLPISIASGSPMVLLFRRGAATDLVAQRPEPARGQTADGEVAADRGVLEVGVDGGEGQVRVSATTVPAEPAVWGMVTAEQFAAAAPPPPPTRFTLPPMEAEWTTTP